ncbi:MAG TPA: septum formation initiator family protein [Candidatus Paceibacterota bacterium]
MLTRIIIYAVFAIIIVNLGYQIYKLDINRRFLKAEFSEISGKLSELESENGDIEEQIEYFSHEANLEKEARARFNYKKPGEKLIIVVPEESE